MKRIFDVTASGLGLILLSPLFLIMAIWIKADSPGPVFYRQTRVGRGNRDFRLFKFRSMKVGADKKGLITVGGRDPRVTRSGYYIRKYKLDELPQLINVFKGDMSLVGPRPLLGVYLDHYEEWEKQKFNVKPGISGLAQVKGNGYLSPRERSYYDVTYTKKASFLLDIKILFQTLGVIFFGEKKLTRHVSEEEIEKLKQEYENTKSA